MISAAFKTGENKIHTQNINPSGFLVENTDLLRPGGKVLDIAAGGGRNSVYLASKGFQVEAVDISKEAVSSALSLARKKGVNINAHRVNLEEEDFISKDAYDVIICFRYLQRSLFSAIKSGLKPGGMVIYETYITDQAQFGRPVNPDYLLKHNELLTLFSDFRCLRYHEGIYDNSRAVAGIAAEKKG